MFKGNLIFSNYSSENKGLMLESTEDLIIFSISSDSTAFLSRILWRFEFYSYKWLIISLMLIIKFFTSLSKSEDPYLLNYL